MSAAQLDPATLEAAAAKCDELSLAAIQFSQGTPDEKQSLAAVHRSYAYDNAAGAIRALARAKQPSTQEKQP